MLISSLHCNSVNPKLHLNQPLALIVAILNYVLGLDFTSLDENHSVVWIIEPLGAMSADKTLWLTPEQFRQRCWVHNV